MAYVVPVAYVAHLDVDPDVTNPVVADILPGPVDFNTEDGTDETWIVTTTHALAEGTTPVAFYLVREPIDGQYYWRTVDRELATAFPTPLTAADAAESGLWP